METGEGEKTVVPCYMCRQPVAENNRFTVSWDEHGEEESRIFCGSPCLRDWATTYSDSVKLDELTDP